jgi:hypothetical protein
MVIKEQLSECNELINNGLFTLPPGGILKFGEQAVNIPRVDHLMVK